MAIESTEQKVDVLRETIVALVRRDGPDLSARQLGVFLTCYREDEAQTVRGLAAKLDVWPMKLSAKAFCCGLPGAM